MIKIFKGDLSPSFWIDMLYHTHMQNTKHYRDMCLNVYGKLQGHFGSNNSQSHKLKFAQGHRNCMNIYSQCFGNQIPEDIWLISDKNDLNKEYVTINLFKYVTNKIKFNKHFNSPENFDDHRCMKIIQQKDFFTLFEFNAHIDPIPSLLTQNHTREIRGFLGQTTAFNIDKIKPRVLILGQSLGTKRVKYIYGSYKKGFFSFYGGHDPEDYQHLVGDPPTNLALHKNSPGYRLILNNIFLPAAKKKKRKT